MTAETVEPPQRQVRVVDAPLVEPSAGHGLTEVFRRRYLLRLLVERKPTARYELAQHCWTRRRQSMTAQVVMPLEWQVPDVDASFGKAWAGHGSPEVIKRRCLPRPLVERELAGRAGGWRNIVGIVGGNR